MTEASRILIALEKGDPQAASQLLPLVYDELRQLAAKRLAREKAGQTIDPTGLVHEAYLRLVGDNPRKPWNGRGHFFAAAAEAMRRILIENARRKRRHRHGGEIRHESLSADQIADEAADERLLAIDEALDRLEKEDPAVVEVVKLRYYAGLTIEEVATFLNVSVRTVNRRWAYARARLYQELSASLDPVGTQIYVESE